MDLSTNSITRTPVYSELEAVADATLLVDNHAHPLSRTTPRPLSSMLTEAPTTSSDPYPACATLAYNRAMRDISSLLGHETEERQVFREEPVPRVPLQEATSSSPDMATPVTQSEHSVFDDEDHAFDGSAPAYKALEQRRATLGVVRLASRCFSAAGIAAILVDDGLDMPEMIPLAEMSTLGVPFVGRKNKNGVWKRVGRPSSSEKRPRTTVRAVMFLERFRARLSPLQSGVVAFKSIAAYRCGLNICLNCSDEELDEKLQETANSMDEGEIGPHPLRLSNKEIIGRIVRMALEVADQEEVPIQFHCGFGDTDLRLEQANPCLLKPLLESFPTVNVVLLHAAWPYVREAAYLTWVFPNCFLDFGLAIPLLSVRGMFQALDNAMEVAPISRLLYSSDAHVVPDMYYLGARWGRRIVAAAVSANVQSGDLTVSEGKAAVRKILADNAIRLYKLPVQSC
ncbi:Amidohydrolase [Gracilaria domingensis]|nr:Amidohydrolase [Gracilaria domingensis]